LIFLPRPLTVVLEAGCSTIYPAEDAEFAVRLIA
jgi:hypothetical protein